MTRSVRDLADALSTAGLSRVAADLAAASAPCIRLIPAARPTQGRSRIGGLPHLPSGQAWPCWNGTPLSQMQDHMELECQLASNGVNCGDPSGYASPEAARLEAGAGDWHLLLQLDTDDDRGMMWGDAGRLYFWLRESDLAAADFEKTWMILQCG